MTAIIKTPIGNARISGYEWESTNKSLEAYLNSRLDPLGPSGGDPNPDDTAARLAVREIPGAVLVSSDETEYEEGVIY